MTAGCAIKPGVEREIAAVAATLAPSVAGLARLRAQRSRIHGVTKGRLRHTAAHSAAVDVPGAYPALLHDRRVRAVRGGEHANAAGSNWR